MKLETTKGEFVGNAQDCIDWLVEYQPSHASVRIGEFVESIDADGTSVEDWQNALRSAVAIVTQEILRGVDYRECVINGDLIVQVPSAEGKSAAEALDDAWGAVSKLLIAAGYKIEYTGDGNTDSYACTTDDIAISIEAE